LVDGSFPNLSPHGKARPANGAAHAGQEHPSDVLRDISSKSRPNGHVIVFANEKGGVGKSTLAFHCSVALANAGKHVAAIDLDRRQVTLDTALTSREGTSRYLEVALPCPKHAVFTEQSGLRLLQEIVRIGSECDFIVIDAPGHDCAIARRAIALADTLVTPVNCSLIDLAALGRIDPVTMGLREPGPFASLVAGLRRERAQLGKPDLNWIVLKNRRRSQERTQQARIDTILNAMGGGLDFQVGKGLNERVAYRELFLYGLTQLDKQFLPFPTKTGRNVEREIDDLVTSLALPVKSSRAVSDKCRAKTPVLKKSAQEFIDSLCSQVGGQARVHA